MKEFVILATMVNFVRMWLKVVLRIVVQILIKECVWVWMDSNLNVIVKKDGKVKVVIYMNHRFNKFNKLLIKVYL